MRSPRLLEIETIALDRHAGRRMKIDLPGTHEAHPLVHAQGGLHHIRGVQAEDAAAGLPDSTHAFLHERRAYATPARGRRHGEQPHRGPGHVERVTPRDLHTAWG